MIAKDLEAKRLPRAERTHTISPSRTTSSQSLGMTSIVFGPWLSGFSTLFWAGIVLCLAYHLSEIEIGIVHAPLVRARLLVEMRPLR